jgi:hypothetical protein
MRLIEILIRLCAHAYGMISDLASRRRDEDISSAQISYD